jgi:antitoxin component of MazEF toxin-antitoxin module
MEKRLVKIGNSMGFVIPKSYLKSFGESVIIEKTNAGILIKPSKPQKLSLSDLLNSTDMDAMYKQMKIEANASKIQKYYKSKEVQDLDNPNDVIDDY